MQASTDEHNHRVAGPLVGLLLGAIAVWFATAPRFAFGPSPQECARGLLGSLPPAMAWTLAAAAAGAVTAALLAWLPHGRHAGGFGIAGACLLACSLPLAAGAVGGLGLSPGGVAGFAAASVVLAIATAPLLRDRGLLSLLLLPVLLAAPVLAARWQFQAAAAAAAPVAAVRSLFPAAAALLALQFEGVDAGQRRQLLAALRPPWQPALPAIVPLSWPEQAVEAEWLQRMGIPGVRFDGRTALQLPDTPLRQQLRPRPLPGRAEWAVSPGRGLDLWVRCGGAFAGADAVLFTPAGCTTLHLDGSGASPAGTDEHAPLRQLLAALPPSSWIRVLVVSRTAVDAYGWDDLTTP